MRRTGSPLIALAGTLLALSGCGGVTSADLFIVYRSGQGSAARLTMLVTEEGGVQCNGGPFRKLEDPAIIKSRTIQEDLKEPASHHLNLPPQPGSVLRYYVRDENGIVHFSDNSLHQPTVLRQLALFVLQTAQQVCHLPE